MYKLRNFISCTFAAVASIFLVGGIAVLSGGILLSISALFGGLALTIITAYKGDNTNE